MSPQLLKKISMVKRSAKETLKRAKREAFVVEALTSLHEIKKGNVKKFNSAKDAFAHLVK